MKNYNVELKQIIENKKQQGKYSSNAFSGNVCVTDKT